jgi:hypothetical protein
MRDQAQDLKEETIEMKEVVEMRDQAQDLKEETIEMKDQAQDLKEEATEIEEITIKMKVEKENLLVLKKNLAERKSLLKRILEIRKKDFQEKNKNLEINFDR